jgi:hypothetical protein
MKVFSLTDFAAHLLTIEADIELAKVAIVERACQMVERDAKRSLGHYHRGWPRLKPETIARKATGDSPLLETGELRDSIEHAIDRSGSEVVGHVGSNSDIAVYQELGTSRIPPRSFLAGSAMRQEKKIHEMAGRMIEATMTRGGPNYRELRELLHLLKEVGHQIKETWDELAEPSDEDEP